MKTAIMTDTNSAITVEEGRQFGIYVLPMPVMIGEDSFCEGKDIKYEQLWEAFEQDADVHTSMPSMGDLIEMWDSILNDEGYDEVVYIPMSSGLSGSCAAAMAAAMEYEGKVQVVDNHRISYTLMNSVFDAKEMADQGVSAAEIKNSLEAEAYQSSIYIAVNSLKYLVKSGRATATAARIASVLNLKPVLQIQGDKLDAYAKAHGMNKAADKMIEAIHHCLENEFKDVDPKEISIGTAGSLKTAEETEAWRKRIEEAFPEYKVLYRPLSCSIACHVGIGAMGTAITRIHYDQDKYSI